MISHNDRHVGRRFDRSGPRFFRGHPGHHKFGGHWQQPTAGQLALGSTAAEVARLFVIAARTDQGNAERQAQLRAFLERSRKELSDLIYGTSQQTQSTKTENNPEVEQA
jgi:hypothetical protein